MDVVGPLTKEQWFLWLKYGLNNRPYETPPVVVEYPELVVLRGVYLRELAVQNQARKFLEIGTARGYQAMSWAHYLQDQRIKDGVVYTFDIEGMDQRIYKTPLTGDEVFTRAELWAEDPAREAICFTNRNQQGIAAVVKTRIDICYIDGRHEESAVLRDFAEVAPYLHNESIVVFDDCDERFSGVQRAVDIIAGQLKVPYELITFDPAAYKIAMLKLSESEIKSSLPPRA